MNALSILKRVLHRNRIHPRRWLNGLISYPQYLGYVKPKLMTNSEEEYRVRRQLLARAWTPRELVTPVGKRLAVLCPHPDDESIGAGGLLWAHRKQVEIHLINFCNGEAGGRLEVPPTNGAEATDKLVEVRRAEFRMTAAALDAASVYHFDYVDGCIPLTEKAAARLRSLLGELKPDVVLLPWFLDNHADHRHTNMLYALGCADLDVMVLGYEIWSLSEPNSVFDISEHLDAKLALIRNYASQLRTVDYLNYAAGLARVRAYHFPVNPLRQGAVEAYVALPNHEYCEFVRRLHGCPQKAGRQTVASVEAQQAGELARS